jgi:hypothetical protein
VDPTGNTAPPNQEPSWPAEALNVVAALGPNDERSLLTKANIQHGHDGANRGLITISVALLRSLRLLGVGAVGPACVGELPFAEVDRAVRCVCELAPVGDAIDDGVLRDWRIRHRFDVWGADPVPWERRVRNARAAMHAHGAEDAFARCRGLRVSGARPREMPQGPMEGAPALELIFDDGSLAVVVVRNEMLPGSLLGSRVTASGGGAHWSLEAPRRTARRLELSGQAGVVLQPSPLDAERKSSALAR